MGVFNLEANQFFYKDFPPPYEKAIRASIIQAQRLLVLWIQQGKGYYGDFC